MKAKEKGSVKSGAGKEGTMARGARNITHEYTQPSTEYLFTDVDAGRVTNKRLSHFLPARLTTGQLYAWTQRQQLTMGGY